MRKIIGSILAGALFCLPAAAEDRPGQQEKPTQQPQGPTSDQAKPPAQKDSGEAGKPGTAPVGPIRSGPERKQ